MSVGIQPDKLQNSVCFQMSTQESTRKDQIAKNQAIIDAANGHLASMTGQKGSLNE